MTGQDRGSAPEASRELWLKVVMWNAECAWETRVAMNLEGIPSEVKPFESCIRKRIARIAREASMRVPGRVSMVRLIAECNPAACALVARPFIDVVGDTGIGWEAITQSGAEPSFLPGDSRFAPINATVARWSGMKSRHYKGSITLNRENIDECLSLIRSMSGILALETSLDDRNLPPCANLFVRSEQGHPCLEGKLAGVFRLVVSGIDATGISTCRGPALITFDSCSGEPKPVVGLIRDLQIISCRDFRLKLGPHAESESISIKGIRDSRIDMQDATVEIMTIAETSLDQIEWPQLLRPMKIAISSLVQHGNRALDPDCGARQIAAREEVAVQNTRTDTLLLEAETVIMERVEARRVVIGDRSRRVMLKDSVIQEMALPPHLRPVVEDSTIGSLTSVECISATESAQA